MPSSFRFDIMRTLIRPIRLIYSDFLLGNHKKNSVNQSNLFN